VPTVGHPALPGPVTRQRYLQVLFASESLTQTVRQLEPNGHDGLPVISDGGQHLQGGLTSQNVLQAVAATSAAPRSGTAQPQPVAGPALTGRQNDLHRAPTPLGGFKVLEIVITAGSPAAGRKLGDITSPPGCVRVSVQDARTLRDPDPGVALAPGDRISLLARTQ
jgi:hypothetical protein